MTFEWHVYRQIYDFHNGFIFDYFHEFSISNSDHLSHLFPFVKWFSRIGASSLNVFIATLFFCWKGNKLKSRRCNCTSLLDLNYVHIVKKEQKRQIMNESKGWTTFSCHDNKLFLLPRIVLNSCFYGRWKLHFMRIQSRMEPAIQFGYMFFFFLATLQEKKGTVFSLFWHIALVLLWLLIVILLWPKYSHHITTVLFFNLFLADSLCHILTVSTLNAFNLVFHAVQAL